VVAIFVFDGGGACRLRGGGGRFRRGDRLVTSSGTALIRRSVAVRRDGDWDRQVAGKHLVFELVLGQGAGTPCSCIEGSGGSGQAAASSADDQPTRDRRVRGHDAARRSRHPENIASGVAGLVIRLAPVPKRCPAAVIARDRPRRACKIP